ncbi:ATP-binding protein [Streptomyces sp. NP160]|uniref:AAA family ATPase n=1 Tax=Streptomyces sp. NP160 TaxID=2586637 RepID=UPI001119B260|nr:ATP-binding protein [Streptomyces sp. NP160]TNM64150.1 ATP-binding protein [Streptomyces sp. NP160]
MTEPGRPQADLTDERLALAKAVTGLLEWAQETTAERVPELVTRLRGHLGDGAADAAVVSREFAVFDRVNLQLALDAWTAEPGRSVEVVGYTIPPHFGTVDVAQMLQGSHLPPLRVTAPPVDDLPSGPTSTTAVWRAVLLLVGDHRGRHALHVRGPADQHGHSGLTVEVAGLETARAQELLGELEALRSARNVYRGQVLEISANDHGGVALRFPDLPRTDRDDVVLPESVLARVERHTLAVAARREVLRASGQHLKRGLLLYGPPGTGKTHTTRYVVTHLPQTTALLLSGRSLHLIGAVAAMARELQPAVVVLEDVDLVAEDRSYGHGTNPVLFELLDAMDGAAADADLLFLLTTNRAEALERALAARPGRVDVALEIGLPDADARHRLLRLYSRAVPLTAGEEVVAEVVARSEGVTASFVKELVRRAVLEAAMAQDDEATSAGEAVREVTGEHLRHALDDLLDSSQALTRALLGVPADQGSAPDGEEVTVYEGSYEPGVQVVQTAQQHRSGGGWFRHSP